MTYEEHINGLKSIKSFLQKKMIEINYEGLGELDAKEIGKTIDVAIEALERQIPKKPKLKFIDWYGTGVEELGYLCPLCDCELTQDEHHCICGQAIDWEVEE